MYITDSFKHHNESILLLFSGSRKAIPFNIVLALLLAVDMIYNLAPMNLVVTWFTAILIVSSFRWFFCDWVLKNKSSLDPLQSTLTFFLTSTFIMGCTWGSCYLIAVAYLSELHEFIIILVFGGMCAGAIASLSVWLMAYYTYILPMFLPVIIYNYALMDTDRSILATMFLLFVIMVMIAAKLNNALLNQTFQLTDEKESLIHELQALSITDALTGLYNRRFFEESLKKEFNRGKRDNFSVNLVSIDVDNFKLINDNFGHPTGDKLLISIASLLKHSLTRANDTVFRLGGDEFAAILINISMKEAISLCENIKKRFKDNLATFIDDKMKEQIYKKITLSMGVVYIPSTTASSLENIVIAADNALYKSKKHGKNRIVLTQLK